MIIMCDAFHGSKQQSKKNTNHQQCPDSFKPDYWYPYLSLIGYEEKEINTAVAEQNNSRLRNLETTVRHMLTSNYIKMIQTFAAFSNCSKNKIH